MAKRLLTLQTLQTRCDQMIAIYRRFVESCLQQMQADQSNNAVELAERSSMNTGLEESPFVLQASTLGHLVNVPNPSSESLTVSCMVQEGEHWMALFKPAHWQVSVDAKEVCA